MIKTSDLATRLKDKIIVQQVTNTSDNSGGFTESWSDYVTVWADVRAFKNLSFSSEAFTNSKIHNVKRYVITIRFRNDLNEAMRIKYNEDNLNIKGITDPDGKRERLEIIAESGVI